jgi:hypothetical protein
MALRIYTSIALCISVLCIGCNDASNTTRRIAADAGPMTSGDAGDRVLPSRLAGQTCVEGECRQGACVHGVCSPICSQDQECRSPELRCIDRGDGRRCSRTCAETADCPDGLLCVVSGPDVGFCVRPGDGQGGDACTARSDCASWRCSRGQCLAPCDETECDDTSVCLQLHTQRVCTPTGEQLSGSQCQFDADCDTGICRGAQCVLSCPDGLCADDRVCIRYATINLCERRCSDSSDCGDDAFCLVRGRQNVCTTRGQTPSAAPCVRADDCRAGRCDDGRCARDCPMMACPDGFACITDVTGPLCRPAGPAPDGARCDQGDVCQSGFCAAGQCARSCEGGIECPDDFQCTQFANGRFCFATCEQSDDCSPVAFCDPNFTDGSICYWRGSDETGAPCTQDRDCRSGYCDGDRCLANCRDDSDCTGQDRCVSVGWMNVCARVPLPLNAACERSGACQDGISCVGGRCLPACSTHCPVGAVCSNGRCHGSCETSDDCRPGRGCITSTGGESFCADAGMLDSGAACTESVDCVSLLCLDGRCVPRCGGCTEEQRCLETPTGSWCLSIGRQEDGAPCETSSSCESGLCLGARCSGLCDQETCPAGAECTRVLGQLRCVGTCRLGGAECQDGEVCSPGEDARLRCMRSDAQTRGSVCVSDADCGPDAPRCLEGRDARRCRSLCDALSEQGCEVGEACILSEGEALGTCQPVGTAGWLEPCSTSTDCRDGWCVSGYLSGRCGRRCATDETCEGGHCVDLARDPSSPIRTCATGCRANAECEAPLQCRQRLDGATACY